jgi:hypothetical protein
LFNIHGRLPATQCDESRRRHSRDTRTAAESAGDSVAGSDVVKGSQRRSSNLFDLVSLLDAGVVEGCWPHDRDDRFTDRGSRVSGDEVFPVRRGLPFRTPLELQSIGCAAFCPGVAVIFVSELLND